MSEFLHFFLCVGSRPICHFLGRLSSTRPFLGFLSSEVFGIEQSLHRLGAVLVARSTLLGPTATGRIPANVATRVASGGRLAGVSGLPETDVARVQRWCRARVPEHVRDEVRVEADVAERHLTIVECRPPWRADFGSEWTRFPIARLLYERHAAVVAVLARPQSQVPRVRPGACLRERRGTARGGQPRSDRHLLGLSGD
jgi:hypothetical protein